MAISTVLALLCFAQQAPHVTTSDATPPLPMLVGLAAVVLAVRLHRRHNDAVSRRNTH